METVRLRLRPPHLGNAPAITEAKTPGISQLLSRQPVPFTLEMAQTRVREALAAMTHGRALVCVIEASP